MLNTYSLGNVSLITPREFKKQENIKISGKKISAIGTGKKADFSFPPDEVYYMYPALINTHDHMRGNYLPKVGPPEGTFYLKWSEWDNDLKAAPVYEERANISIDDMYLLSAYKNLFSGVVTVNDHFPHEINSHYISGLPVRVIENYTLAHACSSFALKWGDGIQPEHKRAVQKNYPFIIHCEEGFDSETQHGIDVLQEMGCLDEHNVLIHCIGFSEKDIKTVRESGANVVWCPTSNIFMFNVTCKIRKILEEKINVSLGTDATHSGSANMFAELKFASKIYHKMYGQKLSARTLFEMVTINPAKAFRMQEKTGSLETGKLADMLVIRPGQKDPYEALVAAKMQDIELLTRDGNPLLGSAHFRELFIRREVNFNEVSIGGRPMLVAGDPVGLMKRIRKNVNYRKQLDFIPIDEYSYR